MSHSLACLLTPHGALRLEAAEADVGSTPPSPRGWRRRSRAGKGMACCNSASPKRAAGCRRTSPSGALSRCGSSRRSAPRRERRRGRLRRGADETRCDARRRSAADARRRISRRRRARGAVAVARARRSTPSAPRAACRSTPSSPRATAAGGMVGRVHFNLAENRKDAERPFAFLATYVSGLAAHGALRHAPLGAALREYAGAGAKAELLKLLEPVSRAGETCAWLKEIVDSGEIFHPLRWTPAEAMRLLDDVEALEQAGLVVRMPASWPANRPSRPAVEATVGAEGALAGRRRAAARLSRST